MKTSYRFLLYNIRYAAGLSRAFHFPFPFRGYLRQTGKHFDSIADFIKAYDPDFVGLVEVDGGSIRSKGMNQAGLLAQDLGHEFVFEKKYTRPLLTDFLPIVRNQGNAVLAKPKIVKQQYHYFEKGVKRLIIEIEFDNMVLFLVHLSVKYKDRRQQLKELSVLIRQVKKPVILGGDFNVFWGYEELTVFLESTKLMSANTGNELTFPSKTPRWELDFIFHSSQIVVKDLNVPQINLSDHLPLVCDFCIKDT